MTFFTEKEQIKIELNMHESFPFWKLCTQLFVKGSEINTIIFVSNCVRHLSVAKLDFSVYDFICNKEEKEGK